MKVPSLALAILVPSAVLAVPIVDTGFEPPANFVGNLNGQFSTGPNPWTSTFGYITNTGPVLGTQSAGYGNAFAPGQMIHHSWVNLGAVVIPVGMKLRASVDIYNDPAQPDLFTGITGWANGHTNELGTVGGTGGNGFLGASHGTDNAAPILGFIQNPPNFGWHNMAMEIEQVSPTLLKTMFFYDGFALTYNGFIYNTHIDTIGGFVSDISLVTGNLGTNTITGFANYDNYKIEIVPEPATMACLGLGALALIRRKRTKP